MNIEGIIVATIVVAAVGLFIGIFLGVAGKKFAVKTDEREIAVREALPGNNCGGCGYPGCDGLAAAIAKGEAPVNGCPVGGNEVGKIIAGIMGQEVVESVRRTAFVKCTGTCEKTKENYIYTGTEDCEMMSFAEPDYKYNFISERIRNHVRKDQRNRSRIIKCRCRKPDRGDIFQG